MFILCLEGKENEGAYALENSSKERVLLLFEEPEDAERFAVLLEADDFPSMSIVEVDSESMIEMCEKSGYNYTVVSPNELLIPPSHHDYI
tara:strand:+ start:93 stop:362 length:270 start_codon:yes stop_codon:yes gene_type:complete